MFHQAKILIKQLLAPTLFRYPPCGLAPDRLALYISGLLNRTAISGDVAEVGCHLGGTAALAFRALQRNGWEGTYTCFDTFGGFVPNQFKIDEAFGTPSKLRNMFSENSVALVRTILDQHRAQAVELVQGDIVQVPESRLANRYMGVLLDMDLSEPTYRALTRFWPRVAPGGAIFVDDCPEQGDWKARIAVEQFCAENGILENYNYGMAVLSKEN